MKLPQLEDLGKPYRVFADVLEVSAVQQFVQAMQQPDTVQGALMPDAHTGYTLPIGAVIATNHTVYPSYVGYDIGCGMCAVPTSYDPTEVAAYAREIFTEIYQAIPTGFTSNDKPVEWPQEWDLPRSNALVKILSRDGLRQLGSLGGGNHFIEIGEDEKNKVWIIIHSGSRGVGHATASHYMRLASGDGKAREGHFGFCTETDDGQNYLMDMRYCLEFALKNRLEMIERVNRVIGQHCKGDSEWSMLINRNHNHAERSHGMVIHRKGATHAEAGMMGVIPGNMLDGSFIVQGKGNPESLWSSSHGAGRVMSRSAAKKTLSIDIFRSEMRSVVAKVEQSTLDESPAAYKNLLEVMAQQEDLVFKVAHVLPILNVKA